MSTELLEQVFQCLTYLFKYLWRIMLKDLANLYIYIYIYIYSPGHNHKKQKFLIFFL
jgi:hypothetical protein